MLPFCLHAITSRGDEIYNTLQRTICQRFFQKKCNFCYAMFKKPAIARKKHRSRLLNFACDSGLMHFYYDISLFSFSLARSRMRQEPRSSCFSFFFPALFFRIVCFDRLFQIALSACFRSVFSDRLNRSSSNRPFRSLFLLFRSLLYFVI